MGAYVTRKDPATNKDREYYKADDGKLYNDYTAAATAFRESKIKKVMGVDANFIDPNKDYSLVRQIAPKISSAWGYSDYANPVTNTIGMSGYKPGQNPYIEAHEAGHLSYEQATPAKFLGVSGRAVTGLSDQLNNPAPLELLGGALLHVDASEEDRAERLSAKYGPKLGGNPSDAPAIDSQGRSEYGNNLRQQGNTRMTGAVKPLLDFIDSAKSTATNLIQGPSRDKITTEFHELSPRLSQLLKAHDGGDFSPEILELNKRQSQLLDRYEQQGGNRDELIQSLHSK